MTRSWRVARLLERTAFTALFALAAAASSLAAVGRNENVRFQHLFVENGLSHDAVTAVEQDRTGFMWFGTQEGLNRFDGYSFEVFRYDPERQDSLPHDWVWDIHEDREGVLWIGTDGGGLSRFIPSRGTFETYRNDPENEASLSSNRVRVIDEDASGSLWVGTDGGGLNRFDRESGQFQRYLHDPNNPESLSDNRVRAVLVDRLGGVWVGTDGGGLSHLDPDTGVFRRFERRPDFGDGPGDDRIRSLHLDGHGFLWIGTYESGLTRVDLETETVERFQHLGDQPKSLVNDRVRDILEDSQGRLWIATDGGLSVWLGEEAGFVSHRHEDTNPTSLSDDRLFALYEDRGGVLWVASWGGLNRWNVRAGNFAHYKHDPSSPSSLGGNVVLSFAEDRQGSVWVGTYGAGLDRFDPKTARFEHFRHDSGDRSSLSDDRVMSLFVDRHGVVWAGTMAGGLNRFEDATDSFRRYQNDDRDPESLSANGVTVVREDREGNLWVGTHRGGLNRFDAATDSFLRYQHDPVNPASLSSDRVLAFYQDHVGRIWLGTEGGGVNRFDPGTGTFRSYRHDPDDPQSLSSDVAWTIHEDRRGILWIGTQGGGLNRWEPADVEAGRARFKRYTQKDGLLNGVIYAILEDESGALWMSTNRGIAVLDPRSETWRHFDVTHGLQSNEFNFPASLRGRDGVMYLGGPNGFNVFRPAQIRANGHVPPVVLTALYKSNERVRLDVPTWELNEIALDRRDTSVAFEFSALDFTAPEKNRYRYRLDGFDEDWVDLDRMRRVTYTNLEPGDYQLRVKASNNDGVWNDHGLSLGVRVAAAPWKTWWAYLIYAASFASALLGYTTSQARKLEREARSKRAAQAASRAKSQFLATMSHELRTPMNGVLGMAELLLATELTDKQKRYAQSVLQSGQSLLCLVDDVLNFSRLDSGKAELDELDFGVRDLVFDVARVFAERADDKNLELAVSVTPDVPEVVRGDGQKLREILIRLVDNAIKFTDEGEILVRVSRHTETDWPLGIRVEVLDTGIGIAPQDREDIFAAFSQVDGSASRRYGGAGLGLGIAGALVEKMGGAIGVDSNEGGGSTFWFTAPLQATSQSEKNESSSSSPTFAGRTVLVADDNETSRDLLMNALVGWGAEVTTVTSGAEALDALEGRSFDAAVLDWKMPATKGPDLIRAIRRRAHLASLPLVILRSDPQVDESVEEGALQTSLVKPVRPAELRRAIHQLLEQRAGPAAGREDPSGPARGRGRVLVAESNVVNEEVLVAVLDSLGYDADVVRDGLQVLDALETGRYRVVLLNLQLPKMSGVEAAQELRARRVQRRDPVLPPIRVVGLATEKDFEACLADGLDEILPTPVSRDRLAQILEK